MTIRDQVTLTALFEDDDQPTGTNFSDLLDSYVHRLSGLAVLAYGIALDLSIGTAQTLYTVPADTRCVPTALVIRGLNAAAPGAVVEVRYSANVILPAFALTNLDTGKFGVIRHDDSSGPDAYVGPIPAAGVIDAVATTTASSRTARADLLGYLLPASDPS